jgi:NO-binding membrane sensor protein with MHYT domain
VSVGRRQSRRKRRAKRRRAELKEFAGALPHELVIAGHTLGRRVARNTRSFALSLSSAGRRARREWAELRRLASTVFGRLVALVHTLGEGAGRLAGGVEWEVLFYALLGSLAGVVLSAIAGVTSLAILFLLSSLLLYLALWKRGS